MREKMILKAASVLLSSIMLVSSAQSELTAFAAETEQAVAAQETAEPTVSPSVQLVAETQEITEGVTEKPTTQPVTEKQTATQATTKAKPKTTEPSRNSKEAEAVGAKAGDAVGETSYSFDESNGTLYFTGSGNMPNYSYSNNAPWYAERGSIKKVVIEDGVTAIGHYAFYGCSNLTELSIPDSVTKLGDHAFDGCTSLKSVVIPDSVTDIGFYLFNNCQSLTTVKMSKNVTNFQYTFNGCQSLEHFDIPDGATTFGYYVFSGTAIKSITMPNSATSISDRTFYGLTDVTIRATVGSYAKLYADAQKYKFESTGVFNHEGSCGSNAAYALNSETGVMMISGSGAMSNYNSDSMPWALYRPYIKKVVIEDGITTIGNYAFYGCSNLTEVSIPNSVTTVGNNAFDHCTALPSIVIPDSVTALGTYVFNGCTALTSVKPSKNVKEYHYTFNGCSSLASFEIPDGATTFGYYVFSGTAIKSVTMPNSVTSISDRTFQGLTDVTIRATVGSYAKLYADAHKYKFESTGVFNHEGSCGSNAAYFLDSTTGVFTVSGSGAMNNYTTAPWALYRPYIKKVVIEDGITTIGNYAFAGCSNLTEVSIPNSVTAVGNNAFDHCTALPSIVIPDSVTALGTYVFNGCTALTSVKPSKNVKEYHYTFNGCSSLASFEIPDGATTFGYYVFSGTAIKSVTMPNSVTSISDRTFQGLTDVTIRATVGSYAKLYADAQKYKFESTGVFNHEGSCGSNAAYALNSETGVMVISGSGAMNNYNSSDSMPWALYRPYIKKVVIEDGVTTIGNYAFYGCSNLTEVSIPNSVTAIGNDAFDRCTALPSIVIPDSVTTLGTYVFNGCTALTSVKMSKNVTNFQYTFNGCSSLASFEIPDGATTFGYYVFSGTAIKSITMPNSVTSISDRTFQGLTDVTIRATVGSYAKLYADAQKYKFESTGVFNHEGSCGSNAAYFLDSTTGVFTVSGSGAMNNYNSSDSMPWALYRPYIKKVVIEDGVTTIGNYAFYGCSNLTEVSIPNSVTAIGNNAFDRCTALPSIVIPDSVTAFGTYVFNGCTALTSVKPSKNVKAYHYTFNDCKSLETFELPDGVTTLGYYVFSGTALKTVTMPNSATSISDRAFYGLTDVTVRAMTGSYAKIFADRSGFRFESTGVINHEGSCGDNATFFLDSVKCVLTISGSGSTKNYSSGADTPWGLYRDYVKTIVIEDGITALGNQIFRDCGLLTGVTLPDSVTTLGTYVFGGCRSLESITVPDSVTALGAYTFADCAKLHTVKLPKNITAISDALFYHCKALTGVIIPDGVTSIGGTAFNGTSITTLALPDGLTKIGDSAFGNCTALKALTLPAGLTHLGEGVFNGCTALKEMVIPENVPQIKRSAFYGCTALESVTLPKKGLTHIGENAFYNCQSLKKITIPKTVTFIGGWSFGACPLIKEIIVPDGCTTIGSYAFSNCPLLTRVLIPESVVTIGTHLFDGSGNATIFGTVGSQAYEYAFRENVRFSTISGADEGCVICQTNQQYAGMILRLTAADGEKTYTRIIEKSDLNTIFGLNPQKTYTATIVSKNGTVFCSTSNITFGDETAVSVSFDTMKQPLDVKLSVLGKDGQAVEGYTVNWKDKDGNVISTDKSLSERIAGEALSCSLKLNSSLAAVYQAPETAQITLSEDTDNTVTVALEEYDAFTLSGKVTDADNNALSNVSITVSQLLDNGETTISHALSDGGGIYKITLHKGDYQLKAEKYSYVAKTISGSITADKTESFALDKLAGVTISCEVNTLKRNGLAQCCKDLSNFDLAVFNKTKNKTIREITAQNGVLYFNAADVSENDTLEFSVTDRSGVFGGDRQELHYTAATRSVSLLVKEKGAISVSAKNTQNTTDILLVFDANGKYLETVRFNNLKATSGNLAAGSYRAVVMGESDTAFAVDSIDTLTEYGLTENEDYLLYTAEVKDGAYTEIKDAVIPAFNQEKLSYLDADNSSLTSNNNTVTFGQFITLRAEYTLKDKYQNKTTDGKVVISIPDNLTFPYNGITVNGVLATDYTFENGVLTVNTGDLSAAIVRVCLRNSSPADHVNVTARLAFTEKNLKHSQPIGNVILKLSELDFEVPYEASQPKFNVSGITIPYANVDIYDNGKCIASGKTYSVGSFKIPVELYKPFSKTTHNMQVVVTSGDGLVMRSQIKTVEYAADKPMATGIYFVTSNQSKGYPINKNYWHYIDLIDLVPERKGYWYRGANEPFTFAVEFSGDVSLVRDVVVVTTDSNGNTFEIPATFDEETNFFMASRCFASNNAPVEINVKYNSDYDESGVDMEALIDNIDSDEPDLEALKKIVENSEITEWLDDNGDYCFGISKDNEKLITTFPNSHTGVFSGRVTTYYIENKPVVRNEVSIRQVGNKAEAEASLRQDGYTKNKDKGNSFEKTGVESYSRNTKNSVSSSFYWQDKRYTPGSEPEHAPPAETTVAESTTTVFPDSSDNGSGFSLPSITSVWETITGDSSLNQIARYNVAVDSLKECYKAQGKDPDEVDDMTEDMWLVLAGSAAGTIGNDAANLAAFLIDLKYGKGAQRVFDGVYDVGSWLLPNAIGASQNAPGACENGEKVNTYALTNELNLGHLGITEYINDFNADDVTTKALTKMERFRPWGTAGMTALSAWAATYSAECAEQRVKELENARTACWDNYNAGKRTPTAKMTGRIDPSGYICEAVDSNRVEGVTCTVYYSPNADGSNAVLWDASEHEQENPVISNDIGYYEWYVPEGYWQVKFEKDGYQTKYTDWLPVPPPQTDVNVAITSLDTPKIKHINAYPNEIEIEFSQYMDLFTVSDKQLTLSVGGKQISGTLEPLNAEYGFENKNISYASKFHFVPDEKLSKDDVVTLRVAGAVNYAGNVIATDETSCKVVLKPETIAADEHLDLLLKNTAEVTIQVQPGEAGANQTVNVAATGVAMLDVLTPTVTTDQNGRAVVKVRGVTPGDGALTYTLENTGCTGTTAVTVNEPMQKIKPVTASVVSGSTVTKGTKVTLSCATPGAEIYYTTDLSCPCILTGDSRIKYTGPIEITEYTTLIAYAVKDGMEDSKTTLFIYDVAPEPEKLPQVTASVESGMTVDRGTKVSLSCGVEGAEIYYTTDLSCPCKTENPARTKYTQPIEIKADTTIIAYAVKDGMEDSKPKPFIYHVNEVKGDADGDGTFTISDVTYIQKYLAEMITVDKATVAKWDYNHDGAVSIFDVTFLQRVLAEIITF